MLAGYNEIVEDGAERLFRMAELASEDRSRMIRSRTRNETMGTVFGFVAFLLFLGVAVWLVLSGYEQVGIAWMVLQFGSTVWIRTYGHKTLVDAVRSSQD
jgi:uncharacterized membrane protein